MEKEQEEAKEVTFDEAFDEEFNETPVEVPEEEQEELAAEAADEPSLEEQLLSIQKERDDWRHKFESNQGRVAAMQRERAAQEKAPIKEEVAEEDDEAWAELVDDFPELATALNKRLEGITEKFERTMGEKLGPITERLEKGAQEEASAKFNSVVGESYENWEEIINTDGFRNFLSELPESIQQLYYSDNPADAIYLLDQYQGGVQREQPHDAKRKKQDRLQRSVAAPRTGSGGRTGVPDDFDSAFDYYASQ